MQDKISLSDLSLTEIVTTAVNSVLSGNEPDGLEWFEAMNDTSRNYIIDHQKTRLVPRPVVPRNARAYKVFILQIDTIPT